MGKFQKDFQNQKKKHVVTPSSNSQKNDVLITNENHGSDNIGKIEMNESEGDREMTAELRKKLKKERKQARREQRKALENENAASIVIPTPTTQTVLTQSSSQSGQKRDNQSTPNSNRNQSSAWNFDVDYNDHFETPKKAYLDLQPILQIVCDGQAKTSSDVVVYDPYYCQGNMVKYLQELSFTNIINQNRDFYADIKHKRIPNYDMLVTNPPYSGEHKVKLLDFLASAQHHQRPFALLLPVYIITKSYWKQYLEKNSTHPNHHVIYFLPADFYEYVHPENTGKDIPPFYSAWIVGNLSSSMLDRIRAQYPKSLLKAPRPAGSSQQTTAHLRRLNPQLPVLSFHHNCIVETIDEVISLKLVSEKRPNPKQRKKMKQKMGI